jgi:antitoxin component YwqK of YwqJK toxin-antitoxin module
MKPRAPLLPDCLPPGSAPAPVPAPAAPRVAVETHDDGGRLVERAELRGGVLDGTTVFFSADGREKGRAEFRAGVLEGTMTLRDEEGRVWWRAGYLAGLPHGEATTWRAGVPVETVTYAEGVRQGPTLTWWDDGTAASSLPYVAGRLEGRATWYSRRGRITRSAEYGRGVLDGECLDYHPSTPAEAVRARSEYSGGLLHGAVTQYDEQGRALLRAWFDQGHPVWSTACDWGTSAIAGAGRVPCTPGDEEPPLPAITAPSSTVAAPAAPPSAESTPVQPSPAGASSSTVTPSSMAGSSSHGAPSSTGGSSSITTTAAPPIVVVPEASSGDAASPGRVETPSITLSHAGSSSDPSAAGSAPTDPAAGEPLRFATPPSFVVHPALPADDPGEVLEAAVDAAGAISRWLRLLAWLTGGWARFRSAAAAPSANPHEDTTP